MKKLMVILLLMFPVMVSAEREYATWWNADRTVMEYPESMTLEAGPTVYGRMEDGAVQETNIWDEPTSPGTWKLLIQHSPLLAVIAGQQTPGPYYEVWEEKVGFDQYGLYWFIRHYRVVTDTIGAWSDHGGGPSPLYVTYYKSVLWDRDTSPRFYGNFRLVYDSRPDVNKDNEIDVFDLAFVARNLNEDRSPKKVQTGFPPDVDRNGFVEQEDFDFVVRLFNTEPDEETLAAVKDITDRHSASPSPSLAPPLIANKLRSRPITWAKIRRR